MKRLLMTGMAVALLGLGTARAVAQPAPPAYATIPAPLVERVPPPPGERWIWQPGHWHWNGARYVWIHGRYVARVNGHREWVAGHWQWRPGLHRWDWVPAHWR